MSTSTAYAAATQAISRCREIAAYSEIPGQTYRPFLCNSAREVQELVRGWMEQAGMSVNLDAAGNLRGLYPGTDRHGRRLLIGSHLDTVPDAGAFDGVLGVVLAVALVEQLGGERLPFAIEVIGFSEEEGVRFGRPFLGSMALAGSLDHTTLRLKDRQGITVEEALGAFGLDQNHLSHAQASNGSIGFLEVHIEQGPTLEAADRSPRDRRYDPGSNPPPPAVHRSRQSCRHHAHDDAAGPRRRRGRMDRGGGNAGS